MYGNGSQCHLIASNYKSILEHFESDRVFHDFGLYYCLLSKKAEICFVYVDFQSSLPDLQLL